MCAGLDTVVTRYTTCPPGGAVELWTINGGSHVPTLSSRSFRPGSLTGSWPIPNREKELNERMDSTTVIDALNSINNMKTNLNLLAAGIFLAAVHAGFGQSTLQFSTNLYYVAENAGSVILTVQRTGDTNAAVSVDYASTNGTAIAGSDYTATSGTLTFAAGETNQTIAVPILNDGLVEPTVYETFTVTLSNPTNAVLGTRTVATVRITDNDKGLQFEFTSYSVAEDAGSVLHRRGAGRRWELPGQRGLCHQQPDARPTAWTTRRPTARCRSRRGRRFKTFTVPILNDGLKEANETLSRDPEQSDQPSPGLAENRHGHDCGQRPGLSIRVGQLQRGRRCRCRPDLRAAGQR